MNIEVDDRDEPPSAPARPTVRATEKSSTSLDVSWNAPENTGPPITGYDVQYRKGSDPTSQTITAAARTAADNCDGHSRHQHHDIRGSRTTPPTRCGCGRRMDERAKRRWSVIGHGEDQQGQPPADIR